MGAAPLRRLSTILLPVLALVALATAAALLWLPAADFVQAQDGQPRITAGPIITSSPQSGDTYGQGESIAVSVTFSETVSVTGEPRVGLTMGERKRWARYSSGNGGATLTFAYTVNGNDRDEDGISIGKNALKLRGGTIADGDGNAANLEHSALSDQASHKVNGSPEEPAEPEQTPTPTPTSTPTPEPEPANSPPAFATENATLSVNEDAAIGANVGNAITATDADGDLLTYDLSGSTAFAINSGTGQITVKSSLDYETQTSHSLSVTVSDGKNASGGADPAVDDTIAITVNVGNVDEAGSVSLDSQAPQAGSPVTAIVFDPDGGVSGETWSWARSADQATWETIGGATGAAYTPSGDDADYYLRATASYTDGHGPGKTAQGATAAPSTPEPAPAITAGPVITSNPKSGDTYGEGEAIVVAATFSKAVTVTGDVRVRLAVGERQRWARYDHSKQDGTVLVFAYKVKKVDTDADGVSIGANQLQLRGGTVADGDGNAASLDHSALADQSGHKVDGSQEATPAEQQQQPQPANSPPQFASANATRSVNEGAATGANVGDAITATDADNDALTYALSGSDAFAVNSNTGQITVKAALDYEITARHSLTVSVSDGKNAVGEADATVDDTIAITVSVGNVDEPGVILLESETDPPQSDGSLTASLSDPDGGVSGLTWSWQRSLDGTTWETVAGATRATYTLTGADASHQVRATASYTDGHGAGKTAVSAAVGPVAGTVTVQQPEAQAQTLAGTIVSGTAKSNVADLSNTSFHRNTFTACTGASCTPSLTGGVAAGTRIASVGLTVASNGEISYDGTPLTASVVRVSVVRTDGTAAIRTATITVHHATVWSATLTVDVNGTLYGCDNDETTHDNCSSVLTEDDFTYGGTTYAVLNLAWDSTNNKIYMSLSPSSITAKTVLGSLTLNVDGSAFAVSDSSGSGQTLIWAFDPDPDWTDGQRVAFSLTAPGQSAPSGFAAHPHSANSVVLVWDKSSDATITKYQYRRKPKSSSESGYSAWTDLAGSDKDSFFGIVSGLRAVEYTFQMRAVDGFGSGAPSDEASATPKTVVNCAAATSTGQECEVAPDWPLIPAGISGGESFRLMFITSESTAATSTAISTYNTHAQDHAENSPFLNSFKSTFRALASTSAVGARPNTFTRASDKGNADPIYWVRGNKVADNYADMFDGSWDYTGQSNQYPPDRERSDDR